jgi:hypothetical protein
VRYVEEIQYPTHDEVHHVIHGPGFRVERGHCGKDGGPGLCRRESVKILTFMPDEVLGLVASEKERCVPCTFQFLQ